MTDYISFPSSGNFFGKVRTLWFRHYQPTKSGNETPKKNPLVIALSETGSKMPRHLESILSGAFNFIGIVALKSCTNNDNLFVKMMQHVTSQTKRKI